MILRNKKTGEIIEVKKKERTELTTVWVYKENGVPQVLTYPSEQFNAEWEGYKPAEPLIEDEAKRSVFKAWAETLGCNLEKADFKYDAERNSFNCYVADSTIEFANGEGINCIDREIYTFRALCGEEGE